MAFARNTGRGPAKGTLEYFEIQSKSAWSSWIAVVLLTLINVLMITLADSERVFLFSSWLPLEFIASGVIAYAYGNAAHSTILFVIGVAYMLACALPIIFWKKHPTWALVAAILYAIDCVALVAMTGTDLVSMLLFHVLIMILLVVGYINTLKAHKTRKATAQNLDAVTQQTAEQAAANTYKGPEL